MSKIEKLKCDILDDFQTLCFLKEMKSAVVIMGIYGSAVHCCYYASFFFSLESGALEISRCDKFVRQRLVSCN